MKFNDKLNLKILSLNVCGIKRRLQYPDFIELINAYDIICFQETKTDNCDKISSPGFIFEMKNRFNFSNKRSGGLIIGYKESLHDHIKLIPSDSKYVLWLKILPSLTKLDGEMLFGNVYIPPENTKYSSPEAFREIERELINISHDSKYICLAGDFNSRTRSDLDYLQADENEIIDVFSIFQNDVDELSNQNIPLIRGNLDTTKNNFGNLLLDLCKYNNLFIINGRIGKNTIGKLTSKNAAVVDYFIASTDILKIATESNVLEFSPLFSDAHCPLDITISFHREEKINNNSSTEETGNTEKVNKWENEKSIEFSSNINLLKLNAVNEILLNTTNEMIDKSFINNVVQDIGDLLTNAAKETFGTKIVYKRKDIAKPKINTKSKPWYNIECKNAKKLLSRNKRLLRQFKTPENLQRKKDSEKQYKKIMNKNINRYRNNLRDQMKTMKTTNPKEYWKLLNNEPKVKPPSIPIDVLHEFFKSLNCDNSRLRHPDQLINEGNDEINEMINSEITTDEIQKCISKLKNNKSSGDDNIFNEYIKASSNKLINVYTQLFNKILIQGSCLTVGSLEIYIQFIKIKGIKIILITTDQ